MQALTNLNPKCLLYLVDLVIKLIYGRPSAT
jgi:hypothetical protein